MGTPPPASGGLFRERRSGDGTSPFERFFEELTRERDLTVGGFYHHFAASKAMDLLSPEERGDLLADLAERPGLYDGYRDEAGPREKAAYNAGNTVWRHPIEVRGAHLGALLALLLDNPKFRTESYYQDQFGTMLQLIDSAIRQGAYLSSGNCAALAAMAAEVRGARKRYRKAETKKMIARAERLEKLAGAEVSATEFLMQRCEGAENPWAIAARERPDAQFWADLLAETTAALEEIRAATKGAAPK